MQRRTLLRLGLTATALLVIAGTGAALWRPGLEGRRLSDSGREVFRALAPAILDGLLPQTPTERTNAINAHLKRLDATIAALSPSARAELSQLLGLLATLPGRRWLFGMDQTWQDASSDAISAALQGMRVSALAVRQQAYHALRDLTNAAYVSVPEGWRHLGYPGPADI